MHAALPPCPAAAAARRVDGPWHVRSWLLALCLLLPLAAALPVQSARAADVGAASVERGVKAAFLYKFLGYVEFPSQTEAGSPYVVGVAGAEDIVAELNRIAVGRNVNGHPVVVRSLREGEAVAGLQLLFIASSESGRTAALLRAAQQANVLTVTEGQNGLQAGSVINFRLVDDRIRFEVSLEAAEKSNLKLSSRLLAVAYAVQKSGS
jgi:hypothetical protein